MITGNFHDEYVETENFKYSCTKIVKLLNNSGTLKDISRIMDQFSWYYSYLTLSRMGPEKTFQKYTCINIWV